jgi:hypothetical protein
MMRAVLAGADGPPGQVIGASSARGEVPKVGVCTVSQPLASVYRAIGIDPTMSLEARSDQPVLQLKDRERIPPPHV